MANTQKYINHLLQSTGITPACSEEERLAAEDIAQIFRDHGLDPEVQEFNAPASARMGYAVMGVMAFIGALFMGIGGAVGLLGTLLAVIAAVLYGLERTGHPVLTRLGQTGVSQNVVAYHQASGPLASPRNRPVVVVAHYDSPRAELLTRPQLAPYRALIAKLMPVGMLAPAVVAIVRILPLPGILKVLLWIAAIALSLVPLLSAANTIANRFFLPYTSGSVCNKSSVAAMLGVMDAVAPYEGEDEFPQDMPFDQYFGEQKRRAAEAAQAAAEAAAAKERRDYGNQVEYDEPAYTDEDYENDYAAMTGQTADYAESADADAAVDETHAPAEPAAAPASEPAGGNEVPAPAEVAAQPTVEPEPELYRNAAGNVRFGSEAIRSLGMLPESCKIEYDEGQEPVVPEPIAVAPTAPAAAAPEVEKTAVPAPVTATPRPEAPAASMPSAPSPAPAAATPASEPIQPSAAPAPGPDSTVQMTVPPQLRVDAQDDVQAQKAPDDPSFDPFAFHPVADEEEDDLEPLPALSDQEEDEEDDRVYEAPRVTYDRDSDYAGAGDSPRAEIASTLSAFGSKTSKFFKGAFAKGKKLVDDFEAQRAAAREEAEAEALAEQEREEAERAAAAEAAEHAEPVDSTTTFEAVSVEETVSVDSTTAFEPQNTSSDEPADAGEGPIEVEADVEDAAEDRDEPVSEPVMTAAPAVPAQDESAPMPVRTAPEPAAPEVQPVDKTIQAEPISAPVPAPAVPPASEPAPEPAAAPVPPVEPVAAPVPAQSPSATVEMPAESQTDKTQQVKKPYSTQIFSMPTVNDKDSTMVQPSRPAERKAPETVDSLMAEISSQIPQRKRVSFKAPEPKAPEPAATAAMPVKPGLRSVPDPSLPSVQQSNPASRASLFDLPDPSASSSDPFATRETPATKAPAPSADIPVISAPDESAAEPIETISAPAAPQPKKKHGLGGLFGRKKKGEQSMSDWLGVDDDYDAKDNGRGIGSWDNFEDDDDGWKGGAASSEGATPEEMAAAVASMGDDELLGHDIWFVATGASDRDGAGMKAFLASHRDKLRGVFFINLESVGAGQISVITTEGEQRVLKGDRRIMNLVNKVCATFHVSCGQLEMPYAATDAYAALESSRRALTIAGTDGTVLACARSEDDQPHNVDPSNIAMVSEIVTEVIRRS